MTRTEFMTSLRRGLAGLPLSAQDEILTDYEAHFDAGAEAGRTEAEVSAALGDPDRLARELRVEGGARRWEAERNPSSAAAAVFAVLGLGAIDIIILLPILMGVVGALFGFFMAAIGIFVAGGFVMVAMPFAGPPGGPIVAVLAGLGMMAGAVFIGALTAAATAALVHALIWYGRLHYRLLKPAIEPNV